jgi:hypothetical protein
MISTVWRPLVVAVSVLLVACNSDSNREDGSSGPEVGTLADVTISESDAGSVVTRDAGTIDVRVVNCDGEDGRSPNHTPPTAADVSPSGVFGESAYVCAGFDDWYALTVDVGQVVSVDAALAAATGDLDLYLYREGETTSVEAAVASGATLEREESFRYRVTEAGTYFLQVQSFEDAEGAYTLSFVASCRGPQDCGEGERCSLVDARCVEDTVAACGDDAAEPNNGPGQARAASFGGDGFAFEHGYEICPADTDVFSVVFATTTSMAIDLEWNGNANLDVRLYDGVGALAGEDASEEGSSARINGAFLGAGTYYVVVTNVEANSPATTTYNLTLEAREGACATDADCGAVSGRQVCEAGACIAFTPERPGEAGAPCDNSPDCAEGLGCYVGLPGFDDNFCTQTCQSDDECGFFGRAGQCVQAANSAICVGACASDLDCPTFYTCNDGACDLAGCGVDSDCAGEALCRRSEQQNNGFCTSTPFPSCGEDDGFEPNDTDSEATLLEGAVEGLICESNDDWYVLEVVEDGGGLTVDLQFDAGDLDVFVFDEQGRVVGQGATDTAPERAVAASLASGRYLVRVNQFPSELSGSVAYTLEASVTPGAGCEEDSDCWDLEPLRISCDVASGSCGFFEGNGEVPLGGACDSTDDCTDEARFCWSFEPASEGRNICTRPCARASDCDSIPGTGCRAFGSQFAVCLP